MNKLVLHCTRRWLITYEQQEHLFPGFDWFRQSRLYWSRSLVDRKAVILTLSPGYRNVVVTDTHAKLTEES